MTIEAGPPLDSSAPASTLDTTSNETTSDANIASETSSLLPTSPPVFTSTVSQYPDSGTDTEIISVTSTYDTPSSSLTSLLPSASSTSSASQHSQSEHNAIIGGVIGAVVVLALICTVLVVWYHRRKHRTRIAPSAAFRQSYDQLLPHRPFPPRQNYDDHDDADEPPPVFTPGDYIGPYTDGLDKKNYTMHGDRS